MEKVTELFRVSFQMNRAHIHMYTHGNNEIAMDALGLFSSTLDKRLMVQVGGGVLYTNRASVARVREVLLLRSAAGPLKCCDCHRCRLARGRCALSTCRSFTAYEPQPARPAQRRQQQRQEQQRESDSARAPFDWRLHRWWRCSRTRSNNDVAAIEIYGKLLLREGIQTTRQPVHQTRLFYGRRSHQQHSNSCVCV